MPQNRFYTGWNKIHIKNKKGRLKHEREDKKN